MGTHWEQQEFKSRTTPTPPKEKKLDPLSAYWLTSFAPKNFYVYLFLCSPFKPNLMVGA
jgi:hypothetical protein